MNKLSSNEQKYVAECLPLLKTAFKLNDSYARGRLIAKRLNLIVIVIIINTVICHCNCRISAFLSDYIEPDIRGKIVDFVETEQHAEMERALNKLTERYDKSIERKPVKAYVVEDPLQTNTLVLVWILGRFVSEFLVLCLSSHS